MGSPGLNDIASFVPCSLGILKIGMTPDVLILHSLKFQQLKNSFGFVLLSRIQRASWGS